LLLERAGGSQWFQPAVAGWSTPATVHPLLALADGADFGLFRAASAVVLPAFLPMVPGLAARLPGTDPVGAGDFGEYRFGRWWMCRRCRRWGAVYRGGAGGVDRRLFTRLMIWGFADGAVAAAICYVGAPWFSA
jgi:hypothetical protein